MAICTETKNEFFHLVFNGTFGMDQHFMDTSAPPIFALELAEAIVHIHVKCVYAGAFAPSLSYQCGLSHTYLPVKSFIPLITGQ